MQYIVPKAIGKAISAAPLPCEYPHCYLPSADQKYPAWPFCVKFGILTVNVVFVEVLYAMIEEYELSGAIAMVASE